MIEKIISKGRVLNSCLLARKAASGSLPFVCVIFVFSIWLSTIVSLSPAQAEKKEPNQIANPDKGLPKSGILSSTYSTGLRSRSVGIWGKKNASVDAAPPLSGSVSKVSDRWIMRVFNNTADSFDVDVRLKQTNSQGSSLRSDNYTLRLNAKGSAERSISATSGSSDAELELINWKRHPAVKATPLITPQTIIATVVPTAAEKEQPALEPAENPNDLTAEGELNYD